MLFSYSTLALPQPSTRSLQHIYQVQLGRFLQDGEFMPEVLECLFPLVSAAIAVYYRMGATMLPTPTKSHYTVNIRDLSKVSSILRTHTHKKRIKKAPPPPASPKSNCFWGPKNKLLWSQTLLFYLAAGLFQGNLC